MADDLHAFQDQRRFPDQEAMRSRMATILRADVAEDTSITSAEPTRYPDDIAERIAVRRAAVLARARGTKIATSEDGKVG